MSSYSEAIGKKKKEKKIMLKKCTSPSNEFLLHEGSWVPMSQGVHRGTAPAPPHILATPSLPWALLL